MARFRPSLPITSSSARPSWNWSIRIDRSEFPMRSQWTISQLMRAILALGVALGVLRSPVGEIVALMAGGVVGCGLAPWFACRGMRSVDRELSRAQGDLSPLDPTARRRASLVAHSYVLIWAAWFFAGVVVAILGTALARFLRA